MVVAVRGNTAALPGLVAALAGHDVAVGEIEMAVTPSREPGLPETLSALLVSELCNVGLTPVADPTYPPLTREQLNWVAHNYLRSATHAGANTPSPAAASAHHSPDDHEKLPTVRSIIPTITSVEPCFTAIVPRDDPATTLAARAGCGASWRGTVRAHCRVCHVTVADDILFDTHRLTGAARESMGSRRHAGPSSHIATDFAHGPLCPVLHSRPSTARPRRAETSCSSTTW